MTSAEHEADIDPLLRKAINLFTFLGKSQQLLVRPVRNVTGFDKVMWFGDLSDHEAIWSAHRVAAMELDAPLLTVDRVAKLDPPAVPSPLTEWVDGKVDDVTVEPVIRQIGRATCRERRWQYGLISGVAGYIQKNNI